MAQLKDTNIDGVLETNDKVNLPNNKGIYTKDVDGTYRQNYQGCNNNNNCVIGYGNYSAENGNTHIYGVAVKAITVNNDVTVDGIQIGHTDKDSITSLASGWADYSTGTTPTVRRYGKVVDLSGVLKNTTTVTLNTTGVKVFTIPSGYRPSQDVFVLCQGSNAAEWLLQVKTNGEVYFARYSDGTTFASMESGKWLPFHATWIMD